MIYYPKTQIRTNLFTNGNEFINSATKELYVGNYYETSLEQQFTGKNPQDPDSVPLIPIEETSLNPTQTNIDNDLVLDARFTSPNFQYSIITKQDPNILQPIYPKFYFAKPTEQDYKNTQFNRYFYKTLSGEKYVEISGNDYNSLINKESKFLYQSVLPIVLSWQISGTEENVARINRRTTENIEKQYNIKGLGLYLNNNYTQFFKFPNISNLYTSGGEFKTKDGQNYIGFYHIHDNTGPMVGKTHTKEPHGLLFPINEAIISEVTTQYFNQQILQATSSIMPTILQNNVSISNGGFSVGGGSY